MFYLVQRSDSFPVHPRFFSGKLRALLKEKVRSVVQGSIDKQFGFVLLVTEVKIEGSARLDPETGFAVFQILYKAIVFRPQPNEVITAIVDSVQYSGVMVKVGPWTAFVTNHNMPDHYEFRNDQFVSKQDDSVRIKIGIPLRIRILGINNAEHNFSGVASIAGPFLGHVESFTKQSIAEAYN